MTQLNRKVVLSIGNTFEFNARHNKDLPEHALLNLRKRKENFAVSAELALFWGGDILDRVALLPIAADPEYISTVENRLKVKIKCISPTLKTGWVCRDLLGDNAVLDELITYLMPFDVVVMPWGVTDYYYQLLEVLEARGIKLIDTGGPDKDSRWVVDYCDSKLGSRSIIEQTRAFVPGFGAPPGYICRSYEEAIQLAHVLSRQTGHPIILKSDIGDGGKGVGLYNATSELVPIDLLINQELWEGVPIVVETAIGDGVDLSTPSIDAVIGRDGAITLMAIENMLTPERRCIGVEMGTSALPEVIYGRLEEFGTAVGKHMAMLGYRGWYDVDFLLGTQDHSLYASEINARRGGGTTPIEIAQRLFGPAWNQNHHFKSFERLYLSRPLDGYDKLRRVIETVNEQVGSEEAGVIELSSTSVLLKAPYLGYLIYAKTAEDVHTVEAYLQTQLPIRVEESVL